MSSEESKKEKSQEKKLYNKSLKEVVNHLNNESSNDVKKKKDLFMVKNDEKIPITESQLTETHDLLPVPEEHRELLPVGEEHRELLPVREEHRELLPVGEEHRELLPVTEGHRESLPVEEEGKELLPANEEQREMSTVEGVASNKSSSSVSGENFYSKKMIRAMENLKKRVSKKDLRADANKLIDEGKKFFFQEEKVVEKNIEVHDEQKLTRKERRLLKIKNKGVGLSSKEYMRLYKEDNEKKSVVLQDTEGKGKMQFPTRSKVDHPINNRKTSKIPKSGGVKILSRPKKKHIKRRKGNNE